MFELLILVSIFSFLSGTVSGLMGNSGSIIMAPLLLYAPPLFGIPEIDVRTVAAVAIVQGVFASTWGILINRHHGYINRNMVLTASPIITIGAFSGGIVSKWAHEFTLLCTLFVLTAIASIIMLVPSKHQQITSDNRFDLNGIKELLPLFPVGIMAGLTGVGGGFLVTPILHRFNNLPIRTAIGTSLGITWFAVISGLLGKVITQQVPFLLSIAAIIGTIPGAKLGATVNKIIPSGYLPYILGMLTTFIAIRILIDAILRL